MGQRVFADASKVQTANKNKNVEMMKAEIKIELIQLMEIKWNAFCNFLAVVLLY